jgi:hypothetical protein
VRINVPRALAVEQREDHLVVLEPRRLGLRGRLGAAEAHARGARMRRGCNDEEKRVGGWTRALRCRTRSLPAPVRLLCSPAAPAPGLTHQPSRGVTKVRKSSQEKK